MATHTGIEGVIHIGTDAIGEIKGWSYTEGVATHDTTTLNDTAETHHKEEYLEIRVTKKRKRRWQ